VAASLATRLLPGAAMEASRPRIPEAYEAYLTARHLANKGGITDLRKSVLRFEEAIGLDPSYAPAHAGLAGALHVLRMRGAMRGDEAYPRAEAAARRAIQLDGTLAEGHTALAAVRLWRAWVLVARGRPEEALREIQRAQQIDPLSPRANVDVGWVYLRLRRYDDAAAQCRRTLELEPGFAAAEACLSEAYARKGQLGEAVAALQKALRSGGEVPEGAPTPDAADPAGSLRRFGEWRLGRLRAAGDDGDFYAVAAEEARLGRGDEALVALEAALRSRAPMMLLIDSDPSFDFLRADPRFEDLVRRVSQGARNR
jgi:tetratricopeptide (TPR) repeat protein